ncbi:MAG: cupredoxin domain-containing protein [Bacteroidota bacterium]|nr:cupredoxin domain-containing protein [Bacteroidota bacterium]MDP4194987.1 cupredoxin domain-containing protein [Bacteroidota bacterium]
MNYEIINRKKNIYYTILMLVFMSMIVIGGCKKNDTVTNSYGGSSGSGSGGTGTNQVVMMNTKFSPASITVSAGTTVKWINEDPINHTVTSGTPGSPDGKFDSGTIGPNGTYSFKFDTKGTYNYYCKIHADIMTGTVIVQ